MVTTEGMLYIVAMTALFGLWAYGAVSLYFDLRYRFLPKLYAWVRSDEEEDDKRRQLV